MKLYYAPRTRAGRPRWLLEEIGAPYELARLDMSQKEHKTPAYLALHPHGAVPTLVDGDLRLIESAAICLYLADKFPRAGLAPPVGTPERGTYYQWIVYAMATLEPVISELAKHARAKPGAVGEEEAHATQRKVGECMRFVDAALGDQPFLLGSAFSAADVVVGSCIVWARSLGALADHPRLYAYYERLSSRPAFQRARAD
jgi:glutathione S-transferase